jgi:DNA primase
MPIAWDELDSVPSGSHFTIDSAERRLARLTADPWAGYGRLRQALPNVRGRPK